MVVHYDVTSSSCDSMKQQQAATKNHPPPVLMVPIENERKKQTHHFPPATRILGAPPSSMTAVTSTTTGTDRRHFHQDNDTTATSATTTSGMIVIHKNSSSYKKSSGSYNNKKTIEEDPNAVAARTCSSPVQIAASTIVSTSSRSPRDPTPCSRSSNNESRNSRNESRTSLASRKSNEREAAKAAKDKNGDLICDYDVNVTVLYELLESSKWDLAASRCRSHPVEARTWVVRRDNACVRWKLLPLHAAVIFEAPLTLLKRLLHAFPTAAKCPDDQGMLPLHLAFRHATQDEEILQQLIKPYPQGLSCRDKRNRIPLDHAKDSTFSQAFVNMYASMAADSVKQEYEHLKKNDIHNVHSEMQGQIRTLRNLYEERMETSKQENEEQLTREKERYEKEKQDLISKHAEEMDELRGLLSTQVGRDGKARVKYQQEIATLKTLLDEQKAENEMMSTLLTAVKAYNDELTTQVRELLADQNRMQNIVTKQQEQAEAANLMRQELIEKWTNQETSDYDGRSRAVAEMQIITERSRSKMDKILARAPPDENDNKNTNQPSSKNTPRRPSHEAEKKSNTKDDSPFFKSNPKPDPHADDISAITENSHY